MDCEQRMSEEDLAVWGQAQARAFKAALGEKADARIKAASETLSRASGRSLDLAKIVESNGSEVAVGLLLQAEALQYAQTLRK